MKRVLPFILIFCLLLCVVVPKKAFADPFTVYQVASIAYAVAQASGIAIVFGAGATSLYARNMMSNQIRDYVGSRSLVEVFGSEAARLKAGKLVVAQTMYNGVKGFLNNLIEKFGLTSDNKVIFPGVADGNDTYNLDTANEIKSDGISCTWSNGYTITLNVYRDGQLANSNDYRTSHKKTGTGWELTVDSNKDLIAVLHYDMDWYGEIIKGTISCSTGLKVVDVIEPTNATVDTHYNPDGIDVGYDWTGTVSDAPDTNLDQLLGNIIDQAVDGTLDVTGETTPAQPVPTPIPTYGPIDPDIPLSDVPFGGLNDLLGQTEQGTKDQIQSQTQSITSAQEATTEAVDSLTETISDALDVPDAEELPEFKFDLRELFPFCIPFDIYRLLSSFDAEPAAPHVQLPIVIQSIGFSYNLDLDFSSWNPVAQAMRTAELIVYAIGLAWATGKVIKW